MKSCELQEVLPSVAGFFDLKANPWNFHIYTKFIIKQPINAILNNHYIGDIK